jgi:cell division protein FtsQ
MIVDLFKPQNRFKAKPKPVKKKFRLPQIDWKSYARRGALVGIVAGSLIALSWVLDRPIRVISIDGSFQRVSPGQVEQVAAPYLKAGFMSADLDAVQRAVETLPWVDHARVQRRWPNSVHVVIVEQVAAARWGESGLLNSRGELFVKSVTHVPPELPRLSGPEGTEAKVAQRYLAAQGRMLEAGMRIAAVRLDERGAWEFDLDNGLTIRLGRLQVDERLERFIHTALQVVAHRASEINYVDMRYSNGFTIGWRTQATPVSAPVQRAEDTDA